MQVPVYSILPQEKLQTSLLPKATNVYLRSILHNRSPERIHPLFSPTTGQLNNKEALANQRISSMVTSRKTHPFLLRRFHYYLIMTQTQGCIVGVVQRRVWHFSAVKGSRTRRLIADDQVL